MKFLPFILLVLLLAACNTSGTNEPVGKEVATVPNSITSTLPDLGEAPELTNEVWLNTPEPLRLANLRGQVVLLEMWTFG